MIRRLNGEFEPKYHPFKRLAVATFFALLAGLVSWRAQYVAHAGGSDHVILQRAAQIFVSQSRRTWARDAAAPSGARSVRNAT